MEIDFTLDDFKKLLGRLSVPYSIEQVNNNIIHIKLWHNSTVFRLRFQRNISTSCYEFNCFLEG